MVVLRFGFVVPAGLIVHCYLQVQDGHRAICAETLTMAFSMGPSATFRRVVLIQLVCSLAIVGIPLACAILNACDR